MHNSEDVFLFSMLISTVLPYQFGNFLLRSQLDCQDPRLPRRTFDLKTRAAIPVRLDLNNYQVG